MQLKLKTGLEVMALLVGIHTICMLVNKKVFVNKVSLKSSTHNASVTYLTHCTKPPGLYFTGYAYRDSLMAEQQFVLMASSMDPCY